MVGLLRVVDRLCSLAVRHSLRDREVRGSIPGRVKPRTLKLVLAADPPSVYLCSSKSPAILDIDPNGRVITTRYTKHDTLMNPARPVQVADFVDVTSDVISISTISGGATSFGVNRFTSGSTASKQALDVYSTPYPEFKPERVVLTPTEVHAVYRTPVNPTATAATTKPSAINTASSTTTTTTCKAGTTSRPENGKVVTTYSFGGGCEGGRGGEGETATSREHGGNKSRGMGKKTGTGKTLDSGNDNQDAEVKGETSRRGKLCQVRGEQGGAERKQVDTCTAPQQAVSDSSTLINAKAGTCRYSSNGSSNRAVTFETPGVSLTDASTELEGEGLLMSL
ncbi:hypothetical protein ElyMa_005954100 [Elysia marginata]|uniref:Uncharacterized protein n=1 Tax=Elysia marginata TaxID=1093978 RepID=A0AAV4GD11_9GAST|nr:hypothetical protein ElyMa_005954100 [Elysia marginata]